MMKYRGTLLAFLAAFSVHAAHAQTLTDGHTDLSVAYDDQMSMGIHQDEGDVDYDPATTLLYVGENTRAARPSDAAYDFIGVGPGDQYWRLKDTQVPDQLYLGIGMDSLDADDPRFMSYVQTDPRWNINDPAKWVKVQLMAFSGPGQVSTWYNTDDGPSALFSTTDGIGANDYIMTPVGGDNHFNWAFTQSGLYDLQIQASAYLADGTQVFSDVTTYHFGVESVPEPASLTCLGILAATAARRAKRRAA